MSHAEWRDHYSGGQSKAFMADLWPTITAFMLKHTPHMKPWRILDVGCGTGHGTALLGSMLRHGAFQAEVTGVTIESKMVAEAQVEFPWCEFITVAPDLADFDEQYDLVIASHVLEHVEKPLAFVRALQSMAMDGVIIYAPYYEQADALVPGHLHSFTNEDLLAFGAGQATYEIIRPLKWGGDTFILELPGTAPNE